MVVERERVRPPAELWMAWAFGLGSTCFLIGPLAFYATLVGPRADAVTFFVGSILFTTGGALQSWLAAPRRVEAAYAMAPETRKQTDPYASGRQTSRS